MNKFKIFNMLIFVTSISAMELQQAPKADKIHDEVRQLARNYINAGQKPSVDKINLLFQKIQDLAKQPISDNETKIMDSAEKLLSDVQHYVHCMTDPRNRVELYRGEMFDLYESIAEQIK